MLSKSTRLTRPRHRKSARRSVASSTRTPKWSWPMTAASSSIWAMTSAVRFIYRFISDGKYAPAATIRTCCRAEPCMSPNSATICAANGWFSLRKPPEWPRLRILPSTPARPDRQLAPRPWTAPNGLLQSQPSGSLLLPDKQQEPRQEPNAGGDSTLTNGPIRVSATITGR